MSHEKDWHDSISMIVKKMCKENKKNTKKNQTKTKKSVKVT